MNDRNEHGHGLAAPLPAVGIAEFAEGLDGFFSRRPPQFRDKS